MNTREEDPFGMAAMVDIWIKSMGNHWGSMAEQWDATQGQTMAGEGANSKAQATMAAALKNMQTMANLMTTPEFMTAILQGSGAMPEVMFKLGQTSWGGFGEIQQNLVEHLCRVSGSAQADKFQEIVDTIFPLWTDIYEKEFKQFFKIPQLGLMRTYQEKANQVGDKYNLFQSTLSEFLSLLALPFSQAIKVMQEKLAEMSENGTLSDDSKVYYDMWVKVLEGHFATLFQTPEYIETMARTINALADFAAARDAVLEDLMGLLPVAKRSDMDDMARDLYELKKRFRKLEKELKK